MHFAWTTVSLLYIIRIHCNAHAHEIAHATHMRPVDVRQMGAAPAQAFWLWREGARRRPQTEKRAPPPRLQASIQSRLEEANRNAQNWQNELVGLRDQVNYYKQEYDLTKLRLQETEKAEQASTAQAKELHARLCHQGRTLSAALEHAKKDLAEWQVSKRSEDGPFTTFGNRSCHGPERAALENSLTGLDGVHPSLDKRGQARAPY